MVDVDQQRQCVGKSGSRFCLFSKPEKRTIATSAADHQSRILLKLIGEMGGSAAVAMRILAFAALVASAASSKGVDRCML